MKGLDSWLRELIHKRSLKDDKCQLKWVNTYLYNKKLNEIDNDMIEEIAKKKEQTNVSPARVNRLLALLRSILNKAERKWKCIEKAPTLCMRNEGLERERWSSKEEAERLLMELPSHLANLAA